MQPFAASACPASIVSLAGALKSPVPVSSDGSSEASQSSRAVSRSSGVRTEAMEEENKTSQSGTAIREERRVSQPDQRASHVLTTTKTELQIPSQCELWPCVRIDLTPHCSCSHAVLCHCAHWYTFFRNRVSLHRCEKEQGTSECGVQRRVG
jgi:hypothetical protein